jgi:hypothetical protein
MFCASAQQFYPKAQSLSHVIRAWRSRVNRKKPHFKCESRFCGADTDAVEFRFDGCTRRSSLPGPLSTIQKNVFRGSSSEMFKPLSGMTLEVPAQVPRCAWRRLVTPSGT